VSAVEVEATLARARRLPAWLWFAPREDVWAASADPARRAEGEHMLRHVLGRGVGVAIATRGGLREAQGLVDIARRAPGQLTVRIGVFSRDREVEARWERGLAPVGQRLALAAALIDAGVEVSAELGPIVPLVNDHPDGLRDLLRLVARAGITEVAPRWIEDGPGLVRQIERTLGRSQGRLLAGWFGQPGARRGDGGRVIPLQARRLRRDRIDQVARELGLSVRECGCMAHGASVACITDPQGLGRGQLELFQKGA